MSRIAKNPIFIPDEVKVSINKKKIIIQGKNGILTNIINPLVKVKIHNKQLFFVPKINNNNSWSYAGTSRSILNSMIIGVTKGFSKKLILFGIGYRVTLNKNILNLMLGYSHPIYYTLPEGIKADCTIQNEILLKGSNKQLLGQVAANIRSYRTPEPYKGKGIRYSYEKIKIKEIKKK
ncbi:50S ribosomal protein L6 [Enterobacteriaceae endosymbiont of Plateumaris consimilis]|uniref:50S ribosomal protein L6 n=1 Tax=Enterobacteriaceae endosymbiont of Plateumaris consimilis TaxID=2675794 RepID=UPI0014491CA9|nr:50S ribosomal protein L6 [Enterobacteriaceae endosymbiont of Plateumaris consimilis]QJC28675.1 50S ribosomal protein L6 [Enterobacteriaceae endosymbiont of Plateumaris consimilis]